MSYWLAHLHKTSILRVNVRVRPLVIAVVGLVGIPVAGALQNTTAPQINIDHGVQVGHSTGQIQKLDIERAAVTLKHGPIVSLGMPDMTMIFRVEHPQHLTGLSVGTGFASKFDVSKARW